MGKVRGKKPGKEKPRRWTAWAVVRTNEDDIPLTYDDEESAFQDSDGFEVIRVTIEEVVK